MKVLFLGGCGEMAVPMLRLLAADDAFEQVTIADLDGGNASQKAASSGAKFSGLRLDATDHAALVRAAREHDLVLSYVGPFYFFERRVGLAAIEAGAHYLSISDDYDAFLSIYTLEQAAREAGVKLLTGFGNSPGLTQALARQGFLALDEPKRIAINWAAGSNEAVGPANILHVMHFMTGTTIQYQDGRMLAVRAGGGKKMVDFPEPIGTTAVYYTGHAESVTIPNFLPGLTDVSLHGGSVPSWIFPFVARLARLGLTATHERRQKLLKAITPLLPLFQGKNDPDKSVGRVEVSGAHEGRPREVHYRYVGHIADITSIPCFVAARGLARGAHDDLPGGVYSAERLLVDPESFLDEVKDLGVTIEYHE